MAIISKEELLFTLKTYGYVKARVANYFDVDEASIRRWCKKYDIDCIAEQWAISLELNDRMHKKYEKEKEKEKKATQKQNQPNCAETILVIADTHEPFTHPRYRDFCCRVRDKYKADCFVHIGDEVDQHALSYHEHNPDGMSAGAEVEAAKKALRQWYAEFPEMYVCVGNHTALLYRKAKTYGIPVEVLKTYNEIWEAPEGWLWYDSWLINGVRFQHGHGKTGMNAHERWAVDNRESTVIGHTHAHAGVKYLASTNSLIFGMNVGCGIDITAYAMEYATTYSKRPVLGCGIVTDNGRQAIFVPMEMS